MQRLVYTAPRWAISFGAGALLLVGGAARADIPAGYKGKPFDPAVAGGTGIVPPTVKAGPYAVPGRIDLANYDMGGDGVGYHSDAHYTTKDGDGYRSDRPAATMCKTLNSKPDLLYDTGVAGQDGMFYPTATTNDFYVGSIHPNDWFNYTVDVKTAGTYTLSSVFATGNGPPGGEGGDGQMELIVFVNETKVADWKTTFPDFQNKANFHNWKPYPSFATITLAAGIQVIKFQAPFKHLNLDYVQLDLMGGGTAGTGGGTAGTGGGAAGTGGGAAGTGVVTTGEAGTSGAAAGTGGGTAGTSGGAAGTGVTNGVAGTGGSITGAAGGPGATPGAKDDAGCACAAGGTAFGGGVPLALLLAATALVRLRRKA